MKLWRIYVVICCLCSDAEYRHLICKDKKIHIVVQVIKFRSLTDGKRDNFVKQRYEKIAIFCPFCLRKHKRSCLWLHWMMSCGSMVSLIKCCSKLE